MPAPHPYLSYFPTELILEVAAYLDFRDVNSLIQSTRRFHSLLSDQLYKNAHAQIRHDGKSPLIWAAEKGRTCLMQKLLKEDPDPGKHVNGIGAIQSAAREGHVDAIVMLIEAGVPIYDATDDGDTALLAGADCGHTDVVQLMLGHWEKLDTPPIPPWGGIPIPRYLGFRLQEWRDSLDCSSSRDFLPTTRVLLEGGKVFPANQWRVINKDIYKLLC